MYISNRFIGFLFIGLSIVFSYGFTRPYHLSAEQEQLAHYAWYSQRHLSHDFKRAGLAYPPKKIALLIFKRNRLMQLYASENNRWHFIKSYRIRAASGGPGPKLRSGDRQVPEGIYHIEELNPHSHYFLSMKLDYPNEFDRMEAKLTHRHGDLGGDIYIHGKAKSVGCVAIGDSGIKELFPLVSMVGVGNVEVIISPDDFRNAAPMYDLKRPSWVAVLYHKIRVALTRFPVQA